MNCVVKEALSHESPSRRLVEVLEPAMLKKGFVLVAEALPDGARLTLCGLRWYGDRMDFPLEVEKILRDSGVLSPLSVSGEFFADDSFVAKVEVDCSVRPCQRLVLPEGSWEVLSFAARVPVEGGWECVLPVGWAWELAYEEGERKRYKIIDPFGRERGALLLIKELFCAAMFPRFRCDGVELIAGNRWAAYLSVLDQGKVVAEFHAFSSVGDPPAAEVVSQQAKEWLDENYPEWRDPKAYW